MFVSWRNISQAVLFLHFLHLVCEGIWKNDDNPKYWLSHKGKYLFYINGNENFSRKYQHWLMFKYKYGFTDLLTVFSVFEWLYHVWLLEFCVSDTVHWSHQLQLSPHSISKIFWQNLSKYFCFDKKLPEIESSELAFFTRKF